ncbi:MAG: hypothetical protein N4A31_01940 [Rickettsiales bacterium]|jgi:hypothetical protein|nr:hypothetical protein [Rickettsiales bacterium]
MGNPTKSNSIGECSKAAKICKKALDKALANSNNYQETYYSGMGKILDKLYASTKIGFECRPYIMWDLHKSYIGESSKNSIMMKSFQYAAATEAGHQYYKINSELLSGKRAHDSLTYKDLDLYTQKMAISSKHNTKSTETKLKQVNGIWLTNKNSPREIHKDDIKSLIAQKKFFENDGQWSHVVWTNDKSLIPKSVKYLEKHNIEVRSIYDYKDELKLFDEIIKLIDVNKLGMASDTLRCSITYLQGGVYADINYKFLQKIDQYCSKYDMFSADHQNNLFCVKKEHIVIKETLNGMESLLKSHPKYLKNGDDQPIQTIYSQYYNSMIKYSNDEGNIDFYYDYYDAHGIKDEGPIGEDNAGTTSLTWTEL